jgi:peptidoglycan/xylan/chitin deacetylase (PgdA/CDA1 family)
MATFLGSTAGTNMKARVLWIAVLAVAIASQESWARVPEISSFEGATVLCYHIVESPQDPRMEISRETFLQHMRYLAVTGYNVIPLRDAYEYAVGKRKSLPKNSVVVTIDDGWRSTYTEVFPEMKKRHFPFTVFVYPRIIGQTPYALTWKQIREMANAGVDIQSHSYSHPFLTRKRNTSLDDRRYAEWLERELAESKRTLERETGRPVSFLAYPYGDYDHSLIPNVARAGYDAALTCDFGRVRRNSDPLRMKRVVIDKKMSFASFRHYLGAGSMALEAMTPQPNQVVDADPAIVAARLPNYRNLDPRSVGIALLSMTGTLPYSYDPRDGSVTLTIRDALKGSWQRALVWATEAKTGRRIEAMWSFRLSEPLPPNCPPIDSPLAPAVARTGAAASGAGGGQRR